MFWRKNKEAKRDLVVGLDLGAQQLKAVVLQRSDSKLKLVQYAIVPSNATGGKTGSAEQLSVELQTLMLRLGLTDRCVRIAISCPSAMVCEAEFPRIPIEEVRGALRLPGNSARYLRYDLSNFYLDALELEATAKDPKAKKSQTMRVLVAAADRTEVSLYRTALELAKIRVEAIELSALTVVNSFRVGNSETCEKEVLLLLDIGANVTSINCLREGQPVMTRIMQFGGNHISEFLGSMLTLEPAVAEEEKLKMSDVVRPLVRQAISPLAREVRSSIDYLERQQECHITRTFVCGGAACSEPLLSILSEEVGVRLEVWNPIASLETSHFNGEGPRLTQLAPALAGAIGAASSPFV